MILCIETSSTICSVSIVDQHRVLACEETSIAKNHSSVLVPLIDQIIKKVNINYDQLRAVAVSSGPGSYTGLRIGVSTAKGIAFAHDLPLMAIPTLDLLYANFILQHPNAKGLVLPMIDARRMEVYMYARSIGQQTTLNAEAKVLDESSMDEFVKQGETLHIVGDAATKVQALIQHAQIHYYSTILPSATSFVDLAEEYWNSKQFVDVAYFEPFYLKETRITEKKTK
jgi:tRNA threonylcarbamoyladenosine biosynthesis protein TsaB